MNTCDATLPPLIRAMLAPEFYPHQPAQVRLVQTHISFVFLAPPLVYKVKKPVRFRFLDFSTPELRKRFCFEEVRLNSRFAPHVYRRVVGIGEAGGRYYLCTPDTPDVVEYAVEMSFLPEEERLDVRLANQRIGSAEIVRIARVIADFHKRAETGPTIAAAGSPESVETNWRDNFLDAAPFRNRTITAHDDDQIQQFVHCYLRFRRGDFESRVSAARIRDVHGDLHADHIYINQRVTIVDCIEFNERLRWCDVAADLAFLAMDLDFRSYPELAALLVEEYVRASGDPELPSVLPFYLCYRAYVRGKVESLKGAEPEVPQSERTLSLEMARRYFELAYRYTWLRTRAVVVLVGLSGTGKSTVAGLLHRRTGFSCHRTDVIRKRLAGLSPTEDASLYPSVYSPAFSERTYSTLLSEAGAALRSGRGVILDGTFLARKYRDAARDLARAFQVPWLLVSCDCSPELVRSRLAARKAARQDASDADWDVYVSQKEHREDFAPDELPSVLRLDTANDPLQLSLTVEDRLREEVPFPGNS